MAGYNKNSTESAERETEESGTQCCGHQGSSNPATSSGDVPTNEGDGKDTETGEAEDGQDYIVLPRKVVIEPALMLSSTFGLFWYALIVQYHLHFFGEKYNLTAILEAEKGLQENTTLPEDTGGACDSGSKVANSTGYHLQQKAQAEATMFDMKLEIASNVPDFFMLLFFGSLMDQVGKRPVMIFATLGMMCQASIYILQQAASLPLEVLYASGVLEAVMGGFPTFVAVTDAYLISTVSQKQRARRLTIADILSVSCESLAAYVMGVVIEKLGYIWPFVLTLIGHSINLVYIWFFVPETMKGKPKWKTMSPMYIIRSCKVVIKKRPTRKALLLILVPWIITEMTIEGGSRFYPAYKLNSPFCWTPSMIGAFTGIGGVVGGLTQLFTAIFLLKWVDAPWVIVLSQACWIAYNINQAAATASWMLWFALIFRTFSIIAIPLYKSVSSKLVPSKEHGAMFTFLLAIQKITAVAGISIFSNIYASTLYFFKGMVFIAMALFVAIGLAFTLWFISVEKKRKESKAETRIEEENSELDNLKDQ